MFKLTFSNLFVSRECANKPSMGAGPSKRKVKKDVEIQTPSVVSGPSVFDKQEVIKIWKRDRSPVAKDLPRLIDKLEAEFVLPLVTTDILGGTNTGHTSRKSKTSSSCFILWPLLWR